MVTLKTFMKVNSLTEINFKKSLKTGREVADLDGISLIKSHKFDKSKEAYVTSCTTKDGEPILVICNQGWGQGETITYE